jgi:hypothetical protein
MKSPAVIVVIVFVFSVVVSQSISPATLYVVLLYGLAGTAAFLLLRSASASESATRTMRDGVKVRINALVEKGVLLGDADQPRPALDIFRYVFLDDALTDVIDRLLQLQPMHMGAINSTLYYCELASKASYKALKGSPRQFAAMRDHFQSSLNHIHSIEVNVSSKHASLLRQVRKDMQTCFWNIEHRVSLALGIEENNSAEDGVIHGSGAFEMHA